MAHVYPKKKILLLLRSEKQGKIKDLPTFQQDKNFRRKHSGLTAANLCIYGINSTSLVYQCAL